MKAKIYRQGDVLIQCVANIPENAKLCLDKQIILAHGEASGHAHTISERDQADWWKTESEQYLGIKGAVTVVHQEHAPVTLVSGYYRAFQQREYAPAGIRDVAD